MRNDGDSPLPLRLRLDHRPSVGLAGPAVRDLTLAARAAASESFALTAAGRGAAELSFHGAAGLATDTARRRLRIVPPGFPHFASYSGQLEGRPEQRRQEQGRPAAGRQEIVVRLPERSVPGSLEVTLIAFPSVLADLREAIDGMTHRAGRPFRARLRARRAQRVGNALSDRAQAGRRRPDAAAEGRARRRICAASRSTSAGRADSARSV